MTAVSLSRNLLGGTALDDFFARSWQRAFALFPGAAVGLAATFPSYQDVRTLLAGPTWDSADMVSYFSLARHGKATHRVWTTPEPRSERGQWPGEDTLNIDDADRWFPDLRPLVRSVSTEFRAQVRAQLFVSPDSGGVQAHADLHDGFVLQIEGRKRWRGTDPDPDNPVSVAGDISLGDDATTFELHPGDVLYVPANAVHATEAVGGPSLSLTLSVITATAADGVLRSIQQQVLEDARWSRHLPLSSTDRERLADAVADLSDRIRSGRVL